MYISNIFCCTCFLSLRLHLSCLEEALALHITADSLQSCRHEGWNSVAKYLVEDVPLNLKLEDVKDVQEVLSLVFRSPPAGLREFIKWVAEVRRQEDGSLILSEEEKGRLAVKVCDAFQFLFLHLYSSTLSSSPGMYSTNTFFACFFFGFILFLCMIENYNSEVLNL